MTKMKALKYHKLCLKTQKKMIKLNISKMKVK